MMLEIRVNKYNDKEWRWQVTLTDAYAFNASGYATSQPEARDRAEKVKAACEGLWGDV